MKCHKYLTYLIIIINLIFISSLSAQSASFEDYIEKCIVSLENNEPMKAIDYAKTAVKIDENDADAHYLLGQAYIASLNEISKLKIFSQVKKAKKEWEKATELDENQIGARQSLINFHLGAPKIIGGNKNIASQIADEIFNIDSLYGYLAYGQIDYANKKYDEARKHYNNALKIDPNNITAQKVLEELNSK